MADYLEKFKGTIASRQTEQIMRLLNKKRQAGQIRTLDEFSRSLDTLVREITSAELKPTFKIFEGLPDDRISSEMFNEMLDRVQDDLEAAFEESLTVDEIQESHRAIIRDVILKNLRAGLAELESKIDLYQFLESDTRGFDSAVFSTFRESKGARTNRSASTPGILFTDGRLGTSYPATKDAAVDLVGERLTLAPSKKSFHAIKGVSQVFDSETAQSELIVEPLRSKLSNLVDGAQGTYWMQSTLFATARTSVKTKLELDFGTVKEINYVEIEPASINEVFLESIYYLDSTSSYTKLEDTELSITGTVAHLFRKIATKKLILVFRNENPLPQQFEYSEGYSFQSQVDRLSMDRDLVPVNQKLLGFLASTQAKTILNLPQGETSEFSGHEFLLGFDNFRAGLANYEEDSIYVSPALELNESAQIGLKTQESRPYLDGAGKAVYSSDTYSDKQWVGSIEHWIVKEDLFEDGSPARTVVFPVLPIGTTRVYKERLHLTEKVTSSDVEKNIGEVMFYTLYDATDTDPVTKINSNIRVFRNGEELQDETDNDFAADGWKAVTNTVDRLPGAGTPMRFRINIVNPLPGDLFTVSYNPIVSTTRAVSTTALDSLAGLVVVDLTGDLTTRAGPEQVIYFDRADKTGTQKSKVYLQVILRQNTAEPTLTPVLEEFTLFGSLEDKTKFETVE